MKNSKYIVATIAISSLVFGCKKSYLETTPSDAVSSQNLYGTTESCFLVLDGIERLMNTTGASYIQEGGTQRANDWGESTVRFEEDNLGQDMVKTPNDYDWFSVCYNYTGIRQPTYNIAQMPWRLYYKIVNSSNYLIDSVDLASGTPDEINYLMGEAYAYRAYSYYKLSLYYCKTYSTTPSILNTPASGLPIYVHGTTSETKGQGRSTLGELYERIVADLDSAQVRLESVGSIPSGRTQADISKSVLYGIYAKVALVMNDWKKAADMADLAITTSGKQLMSQTEYKSGFNSRSNPEWMWCSTMNAAQTASLLNRNFFSFVDPTSSTSYANTGIFTGMSKDLFDVMRTLNDVRKETFTATRQQTKFRIATPDNWVYDLLYMRLAEMYLIKAEALAELGNTADATTTLETLVNARNPGYDYNSTTSRYILAKGLPSSNYFGRTDLLKEIYLQRRIELFMEGVAYSDIQRWKSGLKRPSGTGNFTISSAGKLTLPAGSNTFLFKIAQQEMDSNPALNGQQNP